MRQPEPLGLHLPTCRISVAAATKQPVLEPPLLCVASTQDLKVTSPLFTLEVDMRPALDAVAVTVRKRKRDVGGRRAHPTSEQPHSRAHCDPGHYVVNVSTLPAEIPAASSSLAASIFPLHSRVAKENAEHFQTDGLLHLSKLLGWSDYPLHLYVHCEQISPVPILYARRISVNASDADDDTDIMDVDNSLPVAHLHIGGGDDPREAHACHSGVGIWSRITFLGYGGEVRRAKVVTTRLDSASTCADYDNLCNPDTVGTSYDPSLSVVYLPSGHECATEQLHFQCRDGLCRENTPIVLGGRIPRNPSATGLDAVEVPVATPPRKRRRRSIGFAWEGR